MRLFVWNDPYDVNYGSSLAIAVAETEEEARQMILAKNDAVLTYGQYSQKRPNFRELSGPPLRVLELPCAEIYEWSE